MREEGLARDRRPLVTRWRSAQHPYATRAEHRVRRNASGSLLRLLFNDCSLQISDRCPTSWSDYTSQSRPPITVLRMPSFWAQFKETKEWKHTKPVQRLTFTCWDVKCRMTERSELSRRPFAISSTFLFLLVPQSYPNARTDFHGFWNERGL